MFVLAVCHLPNLYIADAPLRKQREDEGLPSILMLWRADSWQGEFVQVGNVTRSNAPGEKQWSWVDPTIWVDHRNNIHIVANMGVRPQQQC